LQEKKNSTTSKNISRSLCRRAGIFVPLQKELKQASNTSPNNIKE
jgi:hypothetical protein